jgi:hypothetical protein
VPAFLYTITCIRSGKVEDTLKKSETNSEKMSENNKRTSGDMWQTSDNKEAGFDI